MVDRQGARRGKEEELASSLGGGMVWHGGTRLGKTTGLRYTKSVRLNFFSQTAFRLC